MTGNGDLRYTTGQEEIARIVEFEHDKRLVENELSGAEKRKVKYRIVSIVA
ncbi:hypothetical protein J26TS2_06860 [Shouchella clausii]|nr:hypothetical protein J26TS2_06860 [Shouchella clausii]